MGQFGRRVGSYLSLVVFTWKALESRLAVLEQFIARPQSFRFPSLCVKPSFLTSAPVHLRMAMRFFTPDKLCGAVSTFSPALFLFVFFSSPSLWTSSVSKFLDSPGSVKVISRFKSSFPPFVHAPFKKTSRRQLPTHSLTHSDTLVLTLTLGDSLLVREGYFFVHKES